MNLPNMSQPVNRAVNTVPVTEGITPSVNIGCVISKCGIAGIKCIPAFASGGVAGLIKCLGNAAPGCISCFTG